MMVDSLTDLNQHHEILGTVGVLDSYVLPPKSKQKYVSTYEAFIDWTNRENIKTLSEDVLIEYFNELAKKYKPSNLYPIYSMLKKTFKANDNVDLSQFKRLTEYLRNATTGYVSKKPKDLTAEQIQKYLDEAPDIVYLANKVILIFGITGACTCRELADITMKDITDHGKLFHVKITNKSNKTCRTFTIQGQLYEIVKRYETMRKSGANHDRFFQNYQKGKCTLQPIGVNKLGSVVKDVATYLGLPDPDSYTGRCLKQTFSKLQADAKGNHLLFDD